MVTVDEFISAVRTNNVKIIEQYLAEGGDIDVSKQHGTALVNAAFDGHYKACEILLNHGANPNAMSLSGTSALYYVIVYDTKFIKLFMEHGADINICNTCDGYTALMRAANMSSRIAHIELLLEYGADVNVTDHRMRTALIHAKTVGSKSNIEILENWVPKPKYEFISEPIVLVV